MCLLGASRIERKSLLPDLVRSEDRRVRRTCRRLLSARRISAAKLTVDNVPPIRGIYLWRRKRHTRPDYIGVGLGKRGLQRRIVRRHLNPKYVQSVFRIALADDEKLDVGAECTDFIRGNYMVSFLPCPQDAPATVQTAEMLLIAALRPKYNKVKGEPATR